jgi:hypothetical protein
MGRGQAWIGIAGVLLLALVTARMLQPNSEIAQEVSPERAAFAKENAAPALLTPVAEEPALVPNARTIVELESAPIEKTPTALALESTSTSTLRLHGRLIVLGVDGAELPPQDGRFELTSWRGDSGGLNEVEVRQGLWDVAIEDAQALTALEVDELRCGDLNPTIESPRGRAPVPDNRELVIRARVPRPTILRVVDRDAGIDLAGVQIVRAASFRVDTAAHPGSDYADRVVGRGLRSPVLIDELELDTIRRQPAQLLVGATGYAWEALKLDLSLGGERTVSLEPGGDLEVLVSGVQGDSGSHLRLRSAKGSHPALDIQLAQDGTSSFTGLAPGSYTVRAEIGEWFRSPLVLGETAVEIRAGSSVRASLVLEATPRLERANAAGVVYLPVEWKQDRVVVSLELLDTALDGSDSHSILTVEKEPVERDGLAAYRWSRQGLQAGRYELEVSDPSYSVVIDIPPGGRGNYELVVPPPAELHVLIVDAATGADVLTEKLHWNSRRPEGVSGGGLERAKRDPTGRGYRIRAPEGPIDLHLWTDDYQPYNTSVDLRQRVLEHTARLEPACGVVLKLRDRDTYVAFPEGWHGGLRALAGDGQASLTHYGSLERKMMVTEPGTYLIDPPKLSGYRQPPTATIEVFARQYTEHIVELEREHP